MVILMPEQIWGDKLETTNSGWSKPYNLRLKPEATDEEKMSFEDYVMNLYGGWEMLPQGPFGLKKPYYTWEGKIVELESLKGRKLPTAKEGPAAYDNV